MPCHYDAQARAGPARGPREAPLFEFVSKALLALVLDKRARDALEAADKPASATPSDVAGQPNAALMAPPAPAKTRQPSPSQVREMTDARRELIRNALAVQRTKQHLFDNLSEDDKAKLMIAAIKAMGIPPEEVERTMLGRRRGTGTPPKR